MIEVQHIFSHIFKFLCQVLDSLLFLASLLSISLTEKNFHSNFAHEDLKMNSFQFNLLIIPLSCVTFWSLLLKNELFLQVHLLSVCEYQVLALVLWLSVQVLHSWKQFFMFAYSDTLTKLSTDDFEALSILLLFKVLLSLNLTNFVSFPLFCYPFPNIENITISNFVCSLNFLSLFVSYFSYFFRFLLI